MSQEINQGQPATGQSEGTHDRGAGDQTFDLLADFESRLNTLKKQFAEQKRVDELQRSREAELAQREKQTAEQLAKLQELSLRVETDQAAITELQKNCEHRESELSAKQAELEAWWKRLEARETEDSAKEASVAARELAANQRFEQCQAAEQTFQQKLAALAQLESQRDELAGRLAKCEAELNQREQSLQQTNATIEELRAKAQRAEADAQARQAEVHRMQVTLQRATGEVDAVTLELREFKRVSAEAKEQVDQLTRQLAERTAGDQASQQKLAEFESQTQQAQDQIKQAQAQATQAQSQAKHALAQAQEAQAQANQVQSQFQQAQARAEQLAAQLQALTQEKDQLAQAATQARSEIDAARKEQAFRVQELERLKGEAAGASRERDQLKAELAQAREQAAGGDQERQKFAAELLGLRDQLGAVRAQFDAARANQEKLVAQIDQLRAERDELSGKLASAEQAGPETLEQLKHLQTELDAARTLIDETNQLRESEQGETAKHVRIAGELKQQLDELTSAVNDRDTAIEKLYAQLHAAAEDKSRAEADRERMKNELASARAVNPNDDPRVLARRERLRRARTLVRERSKKVRKATDVLRTRYEQAEQVLAQRSELVAARESFHEVQRKLQRKQAGGRVAALMCYSLACLGILAALSFGVARQIFPGTYAARATLTADGAGRDLSMDEREEWQKYHESMLTDPQQLEETADRMKRRGLAQYGTPGAISELVHQSLVHESPQPGTLVIELKGQGADRTQRVLDTLVTSISSQANATRTRRADGAATLVSQPAVAGKDPIDNQRLIYAAIMAGGGAFLVLTASAVFYSRLAAARLRYEGDAQLDAILDEKRWPKISDKG